MLKYEYLVYACFSDTQAIVVFQSDQSLKIPTKLSTIVINLYDFLLILTNIQISIFNMKQTLSKRNENI